MVEANRQSKAPHRNRITQNAPQNPFDQMSRRALETRSTGLFKKGNALFRLQRPKVAVFVVSDEGLAQGYVSHAAQDWPEMHQAIQMLNVPHLHMLGPDNFETVADRQRGPSASFSMSGLATPPSTCDSSDSDRIMAEMLASVLDEPSGEPDQTISANGSMATSAYDEQTGMSAHHVPRRVGDRPVPSLQHSPEPHALKSMQSSSNSGSASSLHLPAGPCGVHTLSGASEPTFRGRVPEAAMIGKMPSSRQAWLSGAADAGSRRRKASDESERGTGTRKRDSKRRRIVTRSQGDGDLLRQH